MRRITVRESGFAFRWASSWDSYSAHRSPEYRSMHPSGDITRTTLSSSISSRMRAGTINRPFASMVWRNSPVNDNDLPARGPRLLEGPALRVQPRSTTSLHNTPLRGNLCHGEAKVNVSCPNHADVIRGP